MPPHPSWCSLTVQESPAGGAEELQHHVRQSRRSLSLSIYLSLDRSIDRPRNAPGRNAFLRRHRPPRAAAAGSLVLAPPGCSRFLSSSASSSSRGILHITSREVEREGSEERGAPDREGATLGVGRGEEGPLSLPSGGTVLGHGSRPTRRLAAATANGLSVCIEPGEDTRECGRPVFAEEVSQ